MNLLLRNIYKSSKYRILFQNGILYLLILLVGTNISGQSPGGVSGASLWLRADQGAGNTAYINVPGSSRTASTSFAGLPPSSSVLTSGSSWSASSAVAGDYLTLDTGSVQSLRGIVTKGRGDAAQWVTSYTVSYSSDNTTYTIINASGTPIIFRGNFDQNTEIINQFPAAVTARYIRITVTGFNGHPSMRADVLQSISSVTADNTSLSVWQDQSGNNNSTFQSNASASSTVRPVFKNNAADNINFNPVVNFSNTQQLIDGSGVVPLSSNTGTAAFILSNVTAVTSSSVFAENLGIGTILNLHAPWSDGNIYWDGPQSNRISAPWGGVTGQPYLWTGWNNSTLTPKTSLRRNGLQIASGATQNAYAGNNSPMYIGGAYAGKIGDLIIYNRNLSADERNRVESYVALKYGLTLDQTAFQNYLNSSSAMIWDAATNSQYNNNIAGIGRDDASGLLQKQSRSINLGIQPVIGNITIAVSNALNSNSFSSNMSSLVWGSDTGSTNLFSLSFNYGGLTGRMARIWRVQETGSVGMVKVALAASQLPASLSQPALVVSSDPTFDGSDTRVAMTLETIGGVDYYTGTADFTTGQYFTFAGSLSAPGGVVAGLSGWYKENAANTGTLWKNATGYDDATATGTNVYNTSGTDVVNFNPSYTFNTSGVFTLPASLDLTGNYSQFGVARLKTAGSSARVFGSALSNVILGYWGNLMNTVFYDGAPNSLTSGVNGVTPSTTDVRQYSYIRNNGPFAFYGNGTSLLTGSTSGATALRGTIGGSSGENSNAVVPEYITYNTNLSLADQNKVETYLAVKYGHTKSGNYTNSAGAVIWTSGGGYDNNIASIARDDASALNQKQSASQNAGMQPVIGNVNLSASNTANGNNFTANLSSLVWGSDTGSTSFATSFVVGSSNNRMTRIWKVQETGAVGTVKVALPLSQIVANITLPQLLVSNDAVFDSSDTVMAMTLETINGVQYYIATVDFTSGQYFTFAGFAVAPGGVLTNLNLWLKGNDGVSNISTDTGIWKDYSGLGLDASAATVANQNPGYNTSSNLINFNPNLNFSGGNLLNLPLNINPATIGDMSVFSVSNTSAGGLYGNDNNTWARFIYNDFVSNGEGPTTLTNPLTNVTHLRQLDYNNVNAGTVTSRLLSNGYLNQTFSENNTQGGKSDFWIGWDGDDGYLTGRIGEVIIFRNVGNAADNNKVSSYLAIKYGITLGTTANPVNYTGSNGTVIWNSLTNSVYQNNIAGIFRDDASALSQKQSQSVNPGLQPVIGNGNITDTNANNFSNFTADSSSLVWGSDNAGTFFTTPFVFGTSTYRMDRIWKVQETGTVGAVKVAVPVNQISGVKNLSLVVSGDASFDGSDTRVPMIQENLGGIQYYTATVDFTTGQFYTFSGAVTGPGGVAGAGVWLRADAGSLSGTTNFNVPAGSRTASTTNSDTTLVPANSTLTSGSSWTPASQITGDYLTLDLGSSQTVNGVVTKGRANAAQWVTGYTISYSTDGTNYTDMGRTYKANFDQNSEVSNIFTSPITARYIRFTVTGFSSWPSMRADVIQSVTPAADTNAVANWTDQSGSSNHAMQAVASGRPTYRNNITDNLNFNPVMNFNGSQNMWDPDGILASNTYTDASAFVVNAAASLTASSSLFESLGTGGQFNMHSPWSDGNFYWDGPQTSRIQAAWGGTLNVPYLWTGWNNSSLTPKTSLRRNGLQIASGTTLLAYTGNNSPMYFGVSPNSANYVGRIGDIIVFTRALSANERNRVDSYNAIKYGLTLDQTTAQNYTNSASGVIWDASANAAYSNNIAGIMRDDASMLNQKQAKSSNTGFQPVIGNVGIAATNAANANTFTADLSSLVWGSDTGNTNFATPFAFGSSSQRMTRIWKVQKTGTVGNVKVAIPLDQLAGNVSRPYLVVSNDATFDGSDTRTEMTLETIAGVQYYTATASFGSGQFYTFSALATAPGGVNAGLVSWNKQNVSNTSSLWKNSVNTNDATASGALDFSTYSNTTNLVNFNESYTLNGAVFTLPAALDVSNTYSVFGVSKLKTAGLNGRVFGSALSNVLIGYWNNLMNTVYYDNAPGSLTSGTNSVTASTNDVKQYTYIRNGGPFAFYGNSFSILSGGASGGTAFRGTIGGSSGENSHVVSPEYITYNTALGATDQNKVESYLALKYGYTKSGNYISSSGTAFWTAIAGYNSNVAGIGRDDNSGLEQKVSRSENSGSVLTLSTNSDFSSPNSAPTRTAIAGNSNFIVIGDDNGSVINRVNTDLMSGFNTRIARKWRIENTGFTQNMNLQFSQLDLVNMNWHLVWNSAPGFGSGSQDLGSLNSAGQITVPSSQLNTGYFTLMANPVDSDGDGVADVDDLDDDNDGILDTVECASANNVNNWQINGSAFASSSSEITLTLDQLNKSGQAWYKPKIDLTKNFHYNFDIFLGANPGGADGIAFVLQNIGTNAVGLCCQGMGVLGITPALIVEFDTYNDSNYGTPINDADDGHIALEYTNTAGTSFFPWVNNNLSRVRVLNMENNGWHNAEVNYIPSTGLFEVYFDGRKVIQTYTNIPNDFLNGATEAYMGFTGSTGGVGNLQKVINKDFYNSTVECDTDGDGVPNRLDLDSDNDGCVDALEGDENVIKSQLVTAAGTVTSGPGSSAPNSNICASGSCVDAQGVPLVINTGGAADIGNDQGQGIGTSQNNAVKDAECGPYAPSDDSDGDGIINSIDLDDDNDGILDTLECPTQFYWTGPVSFSPDYKVAKGTINGVGYTFTSDQPMSSTTSVFQHSVFPASYGVPNNNPTIRNDQISNNVMTFDQSLVDPILVFASLGGGPTVPVIFDRPVEVVWSTCTGSPCSFVQNSPTQITGKEAYVIVKVPGVHNSLSFKYTVAETYVNFVFGASQLQLCDTDGDGIPNQYDLDSDNDGCPDAVEGDENVNPNQLVTAAGTVVSGQGSTAPNKNICASASCIDSQGVPLLVNAGGAADIGNDQGQGIGTSLNAASQPANCISLSCYKPAATSGVTLSADFGISALGRAGLNADNWPMVRKGAWTALEAKTKGFVVNRVAFDSSGNPVGIPPANFIEGMMVYDTTNNCLKVYTTTDNGTTYGWSCMTTQTCPD